MPLSNPEGYSFRLMTFPSGLFTNDSTWQDIPEAASQFGIEFGSDFTLDADTGEILYTGAGGTYLVEVAASIFREDPLEAHAAISHNDDVLTGDSAGYDHEAVSDSSRGKSCVKVSRPLDLTTDDVLQVRFRNADVSGTHAIQIRSMVLTVIPLFT
jgi:hypothetical protein